MYQAFFWLSAGRGYNEGGPQPLILSEILAFMDEEGMRDREERRTFTHYLRAMDGQYIRMVQEKMAAERERRLKESKSSSKVPRGRGR